MRSWNASWNLFHFLLLLLWEQICKSPPLTPKPSATFTTSPHQLLMGHLNVRLPQSLSISKDEEDQKSYLSLLAARSTAFSKSFLQHVTTSLKKYKTLNTLMEVICKGQLLHALLPLDPTALGIVAFCVVSEEEKECRNIYKMHGGYWMCFVKMEFHFPLLIKQGRDVVKRESFPLPSKRLDSTVPLPLCDKDVCSSRRHKSKELASKGKINDITSCTKLFKY